MGKRRLMKWVDSLSIKYRFSGISDFKFLSGNNGCTGHFNFRFRDYRSASGGSGLAVSSNFRAAG